MTPNSVFIRIKIFDTSAFSAKQETVPNAHSTHHAHAGKPDHGAKDKLVTQPKHQQQSRPGGQIDEDIRPAISVCKIEEVATHFAGQILICLLTDVWTNKAPEVLFDQTDGFLIHPCFSPLLRKKYQ